MNFRILSILVVLSIWGCNQAATDEQATDSAADTTASEAKAQEAETAPQEAVEEGLEKQNEGKAVNVKRLKSQIAALEAQIDSISKELENNPNSAGADLRKDHLETLKTNRDKLKEVLKGVEESNAAN